MHGIVVKCSWKLRRRDPSSHSMRLQEWSLWMMGGHRRGRLSEHMVEEIMPELSHADAAYCMQMLSLQRSPDISSFCLNRTSPE